MMKINTNMTKSTNMYSMQSNNMFAMNRSASSHAMIQNGRARSGKKDWPQSAPRGGLRKSFSANCVIETNRGFKPSDIKDPSKKQFLTNLTHKIWKFGPDEVEPEIGIRPVDLEKIFTPAQDADLILPHRNRKMYSSSSFYSPALHPTVEDQVELARSISRSLSDISNQKSKGQSMYVNRKKRSVKWVHEGEGMASMNNGNGTDERGQDENKPILKLIMDPRGQVQDLGSLRKQGYNIETQLLSPEVCMDIVRDLNSPKGKGAELFAKRRKRSEKWVVGETTSQKTETTEMSSYSSSQMSSTTTNSTGLLDKLPPISYLEGSVQRMQNAVHQEEISEMYTRPRVKLIKSPWEAALETGSVDTAFQNLSLPAANMSTPAPTPDAYSMCTETLPPWNPAPAATQEVSTNGIGYQQEVQTSSYTQKLNTVNQMVDNIQKKSVQSNVDVYKPKLPQAWGSTQQTQYSAPYSTLPKPSPMPSVPQATASQASTAQTGGIHMDYTSLNNYNTAARGWTQMKDFYRPITFNPVKQSNLVYTDF